MTAPLTFETAIFVEDRAPEGSCDPDLSRFVPQDDDGVCTGDPCRTGGGPTGLSGRSGHRRH